MEPVAVLQQVATEPVQMYEAPQVIETTTIVAPLVYVAPAPPGSTTMEPVQTYEAPQVIERTIVVAPPVYVEPAPMTRAVEPTYAAPPMIVEQLPPVTAAPVYVTPAPVSTYAAPPAGMQYVTEPVATGVPPVEPMQALVQAPAPIITQGPFTVAAPVHVERAPPSPGVARAAGPWGENLTFRLCDDSGIQQYKGKSRMYEKTQFQSVSQAVASLNGLPNGGQDTWVVVYSQSHQCWYVLYKDGSQEAAQKNFGI